MEELRMLLNAVPDKYDDFVEGVYSILKRDEEGREMVVDFIKKHPESKTDDILDYMEAEGI